MQTTDPDCRWHRILRVNLNPGECAPHMSGASAAAMAMALKIVQIPLTRSPSSLSPSVSFSLSPSLSLLLSLSLSLANSLEVVKSVWSVSLRAEQYRSAAAVKDARGEKGKKGGEVTV